MTRTQTERTGRARAATRTAIPCAMALAALAAVGLADPANASDRQSHHKHGYHLLPDQHYHPKDKHHPGYHRKNDKNKKSPRSLTVDGRGKKKGRVKTIQEAIKRVAPGGTVIILPKPFGTKDFEGGASGGYRESLIITKPLSLIGSLGQVADHSNRVLIEPARGRACVVIRVTGTVFLRALDWVVPPGQDSGGAPCIDVEKGRAVIESVYVAGRVDGAAIRIASDKALLRKNEISNSGIGILLDLTSVAARRRVTVERAYEIEGNTVYKSDIGIAVRGPHPLASAIGQPAIAIRSNQIVNNREAGLLLSQVKSAVVAGNTVLSTKQDGLVLDNGGGSFTGNAFRNNGGSGIKLRPSKNSAYFSDNRINGNACGVTIAKGAAAAFSNDSIAKNKRCYCPHDRHLRKSVKLKRRQCRR